LRKISEAILKSPHGQQVDSPPTQSHSSAKHGTELALSNTGASCRITLSSDTDASRPRVLVVDDEPLIRWSIAEALDERGYRLFWRNCPRGARGSGGARRSYTVVVLDLLLPDSDNLSLLTRLYEMTPRPWIIMMTAHGDEDAAKKVPCDQIRTSKRGRSSGGMS
jgi:CheY-like chemotaxis protein